MLISAILSSYIDRAMCNRIHFFSYLTCTNMMMIIVLMIVVMMMMMMMMMMMIGIIVNKTVEYVNNRKKQVEDERFQEV